MKMRDLKLRRDGSLFHILNFDPKPVEYRVGESIPQDVAKEQKTSQSTICSNQQTLGVHHDHDYLLETPEGHFLHDTNVTRITEDQYDQVECKTRGKAMNKAWRHERTKRVHSSNFGRVCNATERTDFSKLARSYTRPKIFNMYQKRQ